MMVVHVLVHHNNRYSIKLLNTVNCHTWYETNNELSYMQLGEFGQPINSLQCKSLQCRSSLGEEALDILSVYQVTIIEAS